jgi:hypothetical protein
VLTIGMAAEYGVPREALHILRMRFRNGQPPWGVNSNFDTADLVAAKTLLDGLSHRV